MAKRENLSFALVTWTMIKHIHVFYILNSIFTHILHLCATSYFRWCNANCTATFLFVCLFFFSANETIYTTKTFSCNSIAGIVHLIWYTSADNMHISYHLCMRTECSESKVWNEEKKNIVRCRSKIWSKFLWNWCDFQHLCGTRITEITDNK